VDKILELDNPLLKMPFINILDKYFFKMSGKTNNPRGADWNVLRDIFLSIRGKKKRTHVVSMEDLLGGFSSMEVYKK
jgi:hypothetical protein